MTTVVAEPPGIVDRPREPSRARYPDATGVAEREGGRIAWESYGAGDPPIAFAPPWQIVHSRIWKAQLPDFARRHRVITWDARGNGRSDRPSDPGAHTVLARAGDLEAVLDDARVDRVVLVGLSGAASPILVFSTRYPDRVRGLVFICPSTPLGEPGRGDEVAFEEPLDRDDGWYKENIHFWRRDYPGYLEYFFSQAIPEPHSTKQVEDGVDYGLDTDPESLAATVRAPATLTLDGYRSMCASIRTPTLVIQGTDERITDLSQAIGLAKAIAGARLELIEGGGHVPNARHPVRVNLLIRDFIAALPAPRSHARA